jgi:hypothetical protein
VLAELGITPADIGAGLILALAILMIFTGRLVPKRYYEEALSRVEHEKTRGDNWQKAAESLLDQNTQLLARDDVSMTALRAIRASIDEGRERE